MADFIEDEPGVFRLDFDEIPFNKQITLPGGKKGFFVNEKKNIPELASGNPAFLFVETNPKTGDEISARFIDPFAQFTNVLHPRFIDDFVNDPNNLDPANPSGFEPEIFNMLTRFGTDTDGLKKALLESDATLLKQVTRARGRPVRRPE